MYSKVTLCHLFVVGLALGVWAEEASTLTKAKDKIKARTEQIEDKLKKERVTHEFKDVGFCSTMDFLGENFGLEIVIDSAVDVERRRVPVEVMKNVSLQAALGLLCGADLRSSVFGEAVFVTTPEAMSQIRAREFVEPEKPTEAQRKLILSLYQFRTSADFDKEAVAQVISFLGEKAKAKIKIESPEAVKDMTVTMSVKDASLKSLFDLMCGSRLAWMLLDDSILVGPPGKLKQINEEIKAAEAEKKRKAEEARKKAEEAKKKGQESAKEKKGEKEQKQPAKPSSKKETKPLSPKPSTAEPQKDDSARDKEH